MESQHMAPQVDRAAARSLLENQRGQLRQRIITCIEAAYGVLAPPPSEALVQSHDLADRRFSPGRPPSGRGPGG